MDSSERNIEEGTRKEKENDAEDSNSLLYGIEDNPSIPQTVLLGFQLFLSMFSGLIVLPLILSQFLCIKEDISVVSKIISATFFVQGITTFLQATFGTRLPIIQGCSFSFVPPAIALLAYYGECSDDHELYNETETEEEPSWKPKLEEINGGLLMAAVAETMIGVTGFVSLILRFVGPLSIAPVIIILGISISRISWIYCYVHWGVATFTACLIILFTQFLKTTKVPLIGYSRGKGFHVVRSRLFLKYSMFLAILCGWMLSWVLTVTGALSNDPTERTYRARTDINNAVFKDNEWFRLPYPGAIGWPKPTYAAFLGMLAAVMASIVESLGDYNACALISGVRPPPLHAINRGIAMEGIGGIISSLWGTGSGTTSYSVNVVIIGITKVASRRVTQMAAIILILVGIFQRVCSLFATIPDPVVGGTMIATTGMLISVGISLLQKADINSSRNLFVLGVALFLGIMLPQFIELNPDAINTGLPTFDKCATTLLGTGMFISFIAGVILDNIVPGTLSERGLSREDYHTLSQREDGDPNEPNLPEDCYDFPFGMNYLRRRNFTRYIPISPTFTGFSCGYPSKTCKQNCEDVML